MRYIDPAMGPELQNHCVAAAEKYPERAKEFLSHKKVLEGGKISWYGEESEMKLYNALKERYQKLKESLAVFHSLQVLKFHKKENDFDERDFILLNATHGYLMAIEVKKTLSHDKIHKALEQLQKTMEDMKTYLGSDILPKEDFIGKDWLFMPMIYCESMEDFKCCESCRQHIITGKFKVF